MANRSSNESMPAESAVLDRDEAERGLGAPRARGLAGCRGAIAAIALACVCVAVLAAQQAPDRLAALRAEAESLAHQERTLLTELRQLEVERDLQTEQMQRAQRELADTTVQRADAAARISTLETRISAETPGLSARLVEIYKLGRPGYVRLLFDVNGLQAAARGYRTVSALIDADRRRVADFRRALDELRASERMLAERSARIQALEAQAASARDAAQRAVVRHDALITQIDARRDLNARMVGELQAARGKLAAMVPQADRTPAVESASAPALARLRGSLEWPAAGRVTGRFGAQRDARFGTTTVRAGVDIAAAEGAPAAAIEAGVAAYAEPFGGFGNLVIIDHGQQAYSLYGYLDSVAVARGTRVARGQTVGKVGHAPAGKPGLYFELRIDGKAVDPVQWLKKRRGP